MTSSSRRASSVLSLASLASLTLVGLGVPLAGCFEETSCTEPYIIEDMTFDAELPDAAEALGTKLELCIGGSCDTSILEAVQGTDTSSGGLRCTDVDGSTVKFQARCVGKTTLSFTVNTAYVGHGGTDPLVLTAIDASGGRTEILKGEVVFTDATTPSTEGACGAPFYRGTFTKTR